MEYIPFESGDTRAEVNVNNGQLVSLVRDDVEFFHGGGKPGYNGVGWKNSEIVCFPVFGPVNGYEVRATSRTFALEHHGISRHVPFRVESASEKEVTLVQEYDGRLIANPRFVEGGDRPEHLSWFSYRLRKRFAVEDGRLDCELTLTNTSDFGFPFMLGWHPAFRLIGGARDVFTDDGGDVIATFKEVVDASRDGALILEDKSKVVYHSFGSDRDVSLGVSSERFRHVVLWSPGPESDMFSIEHINGLPREDGVYFGGVLIEGIGPDYDLHYDISVEPKVL